MPGRLARVGALLRCNKVRSLVAVCGLLGFLGMVCWWCLIAFQPRVSIMFLGKLRKGMSRAQVQAILDTFSPKTLCLVEDESNVWWVGRQAPLELITIEFDSYDELRSRKLVMLGAQSTLVDQLPSSLRRALPARVLSALRVQTRRKTFHSGRWRVPEVDRKKEKEASEDGEAKTSGNGAGR